MNLMCGFAAILIADLHISSMLLLLGMFFDVIDGLIARLLKVQSNFGKELDSLADLVSFGVAPAYLYTLLVPVDHWAFYVPATFILAGAAIRLAIFNLKPSSKYFLGLATPASTFFLVGLYIGVHFDSKFIQSIMAHPTLYALIPFLLMVLNLSKLKMFSFKQLGSSVSYNIFMFCCLLIFACLTFVNFRMAMPIGVVVYVLLSVVYSVRVERQNEMSTENKN